MFNLTVLRVRRVGNSLGIVLPRDLVEAKGLKPDDPVQVEIEPVLRLADVAGRLAKYRRSVAEWNDATNEGEET